MVNEELERSQTKLVLEHDDRGGDYVYQILVSCGANE